MASNVKNRWRESANQNHSKSNFSRLKFGFSKQQPQAKESSVLNKLKFSSSHTVRTHKNHRNQFEGGLGKHLNINDDK